jgi:D-alanyl-D-alanine carboxypeptidase (penicillin-binding protein 5/6)
MGAKKKQSYVKGAVFPVFCIIVVVAYVLWAYSQPLLSLKPTTLALGEQSAQTVSLAWPSYGESAIGAAGYGVVATSGSQTPIPTASIAKIITALAVLRQHPLALNQQGPMITISQADIASYNKYVAEDGSVVNVTLGEQLSEYQGLEAMLLPSANNIAETMARWAFGSIDAYNTYANNFVKQLGLKSVTVTDPSGFLPTTVASAHDLTMLGEIAMLNPVIAQIVGEPNTTIPVQGTIYNYNELLGTNNNIGIKTGNSDQDNGAYLFAVKQPVGNTTITIVGAIMGGPDLATVLHDSVSLTQSAESSFTQKSFANANQTVGTYKAYAEGKVAAVTTMPASLVTWTGNTFMASVHLNAIHTPIAAGKQVGTVAITDTNNKITNTIPVVLKQSIVQPSLLWRLMHPLS